jgi:hypothetical protein
MQACWHTRVDSRPPFERIVKDLLEIQATVLATGSAHWGKCAPPPPNAQAGSFDSKGPPLRVANGGDSETSPPVGIYEDDSSGGSSGGVDDSEIALIPADGLGASAV